MNDDAELLRRYVGEKSEAAFSELVRRHLDLVYSAALRRLNGDAHAAGDVAQKVFATLARDAAKLSQHTVLTAWLYTATRHAAVDLIRSEQRRRAREQEAFTMQTLCATSRDDDWEKLRPVLDEVMDELPEADRAAVLLRFFEKRPFADIGTALRLSEDAARMRVERSLQKLHALLSRRGVTSTSAALAVVLANQAVAVAPANLAATVTSGAFAAATAGAGAALTGGALTFMSTSKLAVGIAAIVAAVGIGSAIYEANVAARAATELAALLEMQRAAAAKSVDLETKLRTAEANGEAAAGRVAALEKELAMAKQSAAGVVSRPAASRGSSASNVWGNPAYVRAFMERYRTSLALRYGPLYRSLSLSRDQIAKFEAALAEGQQGAIDVWAAASSQGLPISDNSASATAVTRLTVSPATAMHETLEALLGADGLEKYREFDKTRPARELVASLAGNLYYSEAPLTAQQGEALATILSVQTKTVKIPMASDGKTPMFRNLEVTDWDAVNAQAQTLLAPSQLTALRTLTEQTRLDRELSLALNPLPAAPAKQPGS